MTNDSLKFVTDAWPLVCGLLALVVWLVRLEAAVLQLKKDRDEMKIQFLDLRRAYLEDIKKVAEDMRKNGESLARLEGALGTNRVHRKN